MTILFITEFAGRGDDERGGLNPLALTPSLVDQTVAIGAASVQSAVLNPACRIVRITAIVNCNVKFGTNPTASAGTMRLAAGAVEYMGVPVGGTLRIAVIAGN